ncbi:MAG: hypothetical protein ACFFDQ_12585, partial [Candidatus Thorarchaeota archaeon]
GIDRMYSVDVPDDMSESISLRIVDNDRGFERKSPQVSSLYVDMAYIVFEPALEYFIGESPFDIPTGTDCLRIADIDNDAQNEVYFTYQMPDSGPIKYYEYTDGIWAESTVAGLSVQGWVQVEDIDADGDNEFLTMEIRPNDEFWLGYHKYDSNQDLWIYHPIGQLLIVHRVVVGNIDDDPEYEVVASKDPCDGYELKYFDSVPGTDDWLEINHRTWPYYTTGLELANIDSDDANEIFWLGNSAEFPVGESALKYFDIVNGNWVEHNILSVDSGECMDIGDADNDGDIEIVIGHYLYPERENQVRIYEYAGEDWSESIVSDLTEALGPIYHVAIGDVDHDDDGKNEIVIGLFDDGVGLANETIRYYEKDTGEWVEHKVTDTDMTVAVLQIGDVDNDGEN